MRMLFLLLLGILASCATASRPRQAELVGKWRYADAAQSCQYTFSEDGRFTADVSIRGNPTSKFTGRWLIKGDTLLYEYLTDARGAVAPGTTDQDKLLAVRKNSFIIQAADGSRRAYQRVVNSPANAVQ